MKEEAKIYDYDIFEYIIDEFHKQNIKVHAWINPYRLTASEGDNAAFMETEFYNT